MKRSHTFEDLSSDNSEIDTTEPRKKKFLEQVSNKIPRFKIPKKGAKSPDIKSPDIKSIIDKPDTGSSELNKSDLITAVHQKIDPKCITSDSTNISSDGKKNIEPELSSESKTSQENTIENKTAEVTSSESNAELARQHYNSLQQINRHQRHESKIFNLRGFNNYIKSLVISDFLGRLGPLGRSGATVLDLGCGKGGDLGKWGLARPAHLVCVDIADVSVNQCRERYEERSKFKANFIVADCSRDNLDDKLKEQGLQDIEFDLVSCQFALHYGFESKAQAVRMIKNAVMHLKPGCFFFGTIPNSNYLVRKYLSKSQNATNSDGSPESDPADAKFGNDVYYVDFLEPGRTSFPLFGAKYVFYLDGAVQALPEYLIHFPLLKAMLEEEGCECVLSEPFTEYIYKSRDSQSKDSEQRESSDVTIEKNRVKRELKDVNVLSRTRGLNGQGTLLQQEWEVVACYMVFGFRKLTEEERELRRDSKRRKVS